MVDGNTVGVVLVLRGVTLGVVAVVMVVVGRCIGC